MKVSSIVLLYQTVLAHFRKGDLLTPITKRHRSLGTIHIFNVIQPEIPTEIAEQELLVRATQPQAELQPILLQRLAIRCSHLFRFVSLTPCPWLPLSIIS